MRHLVGQAALIHRTDGVAAADDADGPGIGYCLADSVGPGGEIAHFEAAHRAVPDDGLGFFDFRAVGFSRFGADIQRPPAIRDIVGENFDFSLIGELISDEIIAGQHQFHSCGFSLGQGIFSRLQQFVFAD